MAYVKVPNLYTTSASRPAARVPGRIFFSSDGGFQQVDSGSTWLNLLDGRLLPEPSVTGMSWFNQGSSSVTQSIGKLDVTFPSSNTFQNGGMVKSITTLEGATVTIGINCAWTPSFYLLGVLMRESSTQKSYMFVVGTVPNKSFRDMVWTNDSTYGTYNDTSMGSTHAMLRLVVTGTSIKSEYSLDRGESWVTYRTNSLASIFTTAPDQFGIQISSLGTSPPTTSVWSLSFVGG